MREKVAQFDHFQRECREGGRCSWVCVWLVSGFVEVREGERV